MHILNEDKLVMHEVYLYLYNPLLYNPNTHIYIHRKALIAQHFYMSNMHKNIKNPKILFPHTNNMHALKIKIIQVRLAVKS